MFIRVLGPLAHSFGILAFILMLAWLLCFRGGIDLYSAHHPNKILNVHPFLTFFGFIFIAGEAMMAYKTVPASLERGTKKTVHLILHLIAICMGILGVHAAFKFHDKQNIKDMYTLHSWIGILTFFFFPLQWVVGLIVFLLMARKGRAESMRSRMKPWHITGGRVLLYMAICAAMTGLMEMSPGGGHSGESKLVNVLGVVILLFGITVDVSVAHGLLLPL
ncbi:hypothetical protein DM860_001672 [Cuscuta australis]|uniref:ascorbate ferrireductase (transmembrane) n=1 Tax=Cuscuta australis TaxID=267555 RepID=A0A328E9A2_9ASTE|nr:hypothetical protein DM860_001672 [Cuscuta australis]